MRIIKKVVVLTVIVSTAIILGACAANKNSIKNTSQTSNKKSITIGYLPITHALTILEEKQLLEKQNDQLSIELIKFSSWSDLTDALNAGRIDGGSVLMELAMSAVSQGIDLKAVALGHKAGNVIVVGNDIKKAEDLKGKTFAIPHNQSSHNILLQDMLSSAGLTTQDITITQLPPSEMPSSLASGAIAGYCVAEPFGAQAVSQNFGHVLYDSEELWEDSLCCALVLRNDYIENNKKKVSQLIEKYYEAGNALDNATAKKVAKTYLGQEESVLDVSLQWIHFDDLKITEESYEKLTSKVKKYKINENPPTFDEFVYVQ